MKEKWTPHIIAVMAFVVFIVLGLACASEPPPSAPVQPKEIVYQEITAKDLQEAKNYKSGQGFKIIDGIEYKDGDELFGLKSDAQRLRFGTRIIGDDNYTINARIAGIEKFTFYILVINYGTGNAFGIDRIEGLRSLDEVRAEVAAKKAEEAAKKEAERVAQEEARQAQIRQAEQEKIRPEQERLANLYRQAGNNLGNLRNTSRRYGVVFGSDYITTIYNFGDGNYIVQTESILGLRVSPKTGTYRVNGDTVIFLSSEGNYSYGTIVGTALNIGNDIYR
jgi:hypothetical protein